MLGIRRAIRRLRAAGGRQLVLSASVLVLLSIGLSLILASGPYLQSAVTSFISGEKSSIYSGISEQGVAGFPTISQYLSLALWPPYLIISALSSVAMMCARSKRAFVFYVTILIGVGLTLIDVWPSEASAQSLVVSAVCNFAAGLVLGLLSFLLFACAQKFWPVTKAFPELTAWALWFFVAPAFLAAILFFVLAYLIKIPSTTVSFRVEPPISGAMSIYENGWCSANANNDVAQSSKGNEAASCVASKGHSTSEKNSFSLLEKFTTPDAGSVRWIGYSKAMSAAWTSGSLDSRVLQLRATQGCTTIDRPKSITKAKPFISYDAKSASIKPDDGLAQFLVLENDKRRSVVGSDVDDGLVQFSVLPAGDDASRLEVNRFVTEGVLRVTDPGKGRGAELGLYPFGRDNKTLSNRSISLQVDQRKPVVIDVRFKLGKVPPGAKIQCKELPMVPTASGFSAVADQPFIGLALTTTLPELVSFEDLNKSDALEIRGANGWITSGKYKKTEIDDFTSPGKLAMLSIFGNVKDVEVGDQSVAVGSTSTLQTRGKLRAVSDGSTLIFSGDADLMFLNERRLTQTRWEQLDVAFRVPIILGVPTLLYFLINLLREALRRPMRRIWRIPLRSAASRRV